MRLSRSLPLACFFASTLFAADPFLGSWQLNPEKSRYVPGPTPQSLTMVWTQEGAGTRVRAEGSMPGGRPIKEQYVAFYDGKERESKGPWNFDIVTNRIISDREREDVFKRKGAVVGRCKLEVSPDGATLTQRWDFGEMKDLRVFDRQ